LRVESPLPINAVCLHSFKHWTSVECIFYDGGYRPQTLYRNIYRALCLLVPGDWYFFQCLHGIWTFGFCRALLMFNL